jgi:hypothetical protein
VLHCVLQLAVTQLEIACCAPAQLASDASIPQVVELTAEQLTLPPGQMQLR